jgi:cephalosporin hydroxylase
MIPTPTLSLAEAAAWRPDLRGEDSEDIIAFYHAVVPGLQREAHVVEVGVAWGRSLIFLAEMRAAFGHTGWTEGVDTWLGPAWPLASARSNMTYHEALQSVVANCTHKELERVTLKRCDSSEAAEFTPPRSRDLVFIDGDHSKAAVEDDIRAWRSRVKAGGLLAGHDYCRAFPGVVAAVDLLLKPQLVVHGTVWVHQA